MYRVSLLTAASAVVAITSQAAEAFSTTPSSGVSFFRMDSTTSRAAFHNKDDVKTTASTILFGILDDILQEEETKDEDVSEDERLVDLYHALIFASNVRSEISTRLEECLDSEFLDYLNNLLQASQDEEEQKGLTELISDIKEVEATMMAKKDVVEDEKTNTKEATESESPPEDPSSVAVSRTKKAMSNADVLRKASEIDAAIALSDDEKPSDFISDCREVVNLSGGFNDSGRMRVGGR